jgi:hypothetical protein
MTVLMVWGCQQGPVGHDAQRHDMTLPNAHRAVPGPRVGNDDPIRHGMVRALCSIVSCPIVSCQTRQWLDPPVWPFIVCPLVSFLIEG